MKEKLYENEFDTLIQPTDWRFSAAIVGLKLYLDWLDAKDGLKRFKLLSDCSQPVEGAIKGFDGILYNQSEITEERYLEFAEAYFSDDMTHKTILEILENDEFDDEHIKIVNNLVASKTVLKNLIGKTKFDGTNKAIFINVINENRAEIVKSIFRSGENLYSKFCNKNLLLTESNHSCRLLGYNIDKGKKSKFLGFGFAKDSFVGNDILEFDFIPFAFSNTYESYFINNNYSVQALCETAKSFKDKLAETEVKNPRTKLLSVLKNSKEFINFDVEIITKNRDEKLFRTLFVRYDRLKVLQNIPDYALRFTCKLNENNWLYLENEVYNRCLNGILLDDLIELMLKLYSNGDVNASFVKSKIEILVKINDNWEGNNLSKEIENAKEMGAEVSQTLSKQGKGNKIISYRQKIVGAIVAHDYDRVNEILLNLSTYVGMDFDFAFPLYENPEKNKSIAIVFASKLMDLTDKNEKKENKNEK